MNYKIKKSHVIGMAVIMFISLIAYCSRKQPTDLDDPVSTSSDIPTEYLDLFPADNARLLVPDESHYYKSQSPLSTVFFNDKKYFIEIYKIGKADRYPLTKIITTTPNWTALPNGIPYQSLTESLFDVWSRPFGNEISRIYLNIHGDSLKMVAQSDSLVSVYFRFNDFSLQYNKPDTIRMIAKAGHFNEGDYEIYTRSTYPIILTFIKKDHSIYLLVMSINDSATKLPPDLLYHLITEKYDEQHNKLSNTLSK